MTSKKSWDKRFFGKTRPIIKKFSFEKKPTIKIAHSLDRNKNSESYRSETDVVSQNAGFLIQPSDDRADRISPNSLMNKQEEITSKIENIEKKAELKTEKSSDKSTLTELIADVRDLYHDAVELRNDTHEIVDDIKHGRVDEVMDDVSEIVEESREIIEETREAINDFKYLYGVVAGLTPLLLWGLSIFVLKRPK